MASQINIGKSIDISGNTTPELVNLNNIKKNPHTISVPKIEIEVNFAILKNLLFIEAYAKISSSKGIIKNGITN